MTLLEVFPTFRYLVFWTASMNSSKELGSFRFCKSSHMIWKKDILKNDFKCRPFHSLTVHFTSDAEWLCRSQCGLSGTCCRCRTLWLRPRSGGEEPSVKPRAEGVKPSAVTLPPWSCRGYLASWNLLGKVEMTFQMSSDRCAGPLSSGCLDTQISSESFSAGSSHWSLRCSRIVNYCNVLYN